MNLHHNQKVTCEINGVKITDARISINKDRKMFICQSVKDGANADNKLGYNYSYYFNKDDVEYFKIQPLDEIVVGSRLVDYSGAVRTVLGIETRYELSRVSDQTKLYVGYTKQELDRAGYKLLHNRTLEEVLSNPTDEEKEKIKKVLNLK